VSPDGKVVAAVNSDNHVLYYPTDGSTPRPVAGAQPGELPVRWSDDGRYVWLLWRSGLPAKLIRIEAATGRREIWKELTPLDPTGVISVNSIALTGDGSSYAFSAAWQLSELYVADGLR
jgi:hypothetical protein